MKIAVSAKSNNLDSQIDPRFGRAPYILIVDTQSLEYEAVDNSANRDALKGAGIQAAAAVSRKGAEVLLTGYCGPKAFQALDAAGIQVAGDVSGTVKNAVKDFSEGRISFTETANADAHW